MYSSLSWAQSYQDGALFSDFTQESTARSVGVGGAMGAVGADFGALSINPAGVALYHNSEFSFTPNLRINSYESKYLNGAYSDNTTRFGIASVGLVFASEHKERDWRYTTFAFGLNQMANFNQQFFISGYNTESSLTQYFAQEAGSTNSEDLVDLGALGPEGAYQTYLINPNASNTYDAVIDGNVQQSEQDVVRGAARELTFAYGGSYKDKLYLGGSLNVPLLSRRVDTEYYETDDANVHDNFNNFNLLESVKTTGSGINLKIGLIYRLTEDLRFGASFDSPTWYGLTDEFYSSINSNVSVNNQFNTYSYDSPFGVFDYRFRTPYNFTGSLMYQYKDKGFISADVSMVDYQSMRYSADGDFGLYTQFFNELNNSIQENLTAATNVRIGGEIVLSPLYLRAGYAYYGSPYVDSNSQSARSIISGGLGFRTNTMYIDLAYATQKYSHFYRPYTLVDELTQGADIDTQIGNISLTLGFKL